MMKKRRRAEDFKTAADKRARREKHPIPGRWPMIAVTPGEPGGIGPEEFRWERLCSRDIGGRQSYPAAADNGLFVDQVHRR